MNNLVFEKLYSKLNRKLLSLNWLNKLNIPFNMVNDGLKADSFKNNLKDLIFERDYSCKRVLYLCNEIIDNLVPFSKPDNWLDYLYQYTLAKSFPEAVIIKIDTAYNSACEFYLRVLRIIAEVQKTSQDGTWQSLYPMDFLTLEEENSLEYPEEYRKFLKAFKHNYTYEMMKLNEEVFGFNTLDHICGVHFLALFIARQLKEAGIPIDLGRVSGAAAGHDIGKYGCKGSELKRVPYLHYYYSDLWFKRYGINYIRNIAINHSTWDLELENLPIESLILIYSDFRVKNKRFLENEKMCIFTLDESFNVILKKLDNVDEVKEKRYRKVYNKLKDFEEYMQDLGISTEITNKKWLITESNQNYSLLQGEKIIQSLKNLAINHNINLMYQLRDEYSLEHILEMARSEKDWKNLREYLRIFQEYSTYLTQNQKLQTLKFLLENLIHPEDDIRRHCAELIGTLISIFDEDYRKEIPENVKLESPAITSYELLKEYIENLLSPGGKVIFAHRFLMGYSISIIVSSLFRNCKKDTLLQYRIVLIKFYENIQNRNSDELLFLLETIKEIPLEPFETNLKPIFDFVLAMLNKHSISLRISSLEALYKILPLIPHSSSIIQEVKNYFSLKYRKSNIPSENYYKYKITQYLNLEDMSEVFQVFCKSDEKKIPDMFLSNLKTATDWVRKKSQILLLEEYTIENIQANGLHSAIHFCNLLKVSAVESVRNSAGEAILQLMPSLSLAERNEVAVELLRALEIEGNKFTEYIPYYIGRIILFLQPVELNEIIEDLQAKIKSSSTNVKSLVLKTIGVALSHYSSYSLRFTESHEASEKRLVFMLGIILNALGDYDTKVQQTSLSVIGKDIFGTELLDFKEKEHIFKLIGKKIITLITDNKNEELLFLANSAALNNIYRFLSDYIFLFGALKIPIPERVAFFPGTFDPFSLSHKEIAKDIRDLGFEVYLSVDEFSWSKKTLPNMLRRNILSMSIADELNIYLYPHNLSTNIANVLDLCDLKKNFINSELYIAVGSDVLLNASSYKVDVGNDTIHSFNHIIFERNRSKRLEEAVKNIRGKIVWLTLPQKYSDISSTQIRNYIDDNRDISSLIDPLAQQFIYDNGFYQKEPLEKSSVASLRYKVEILESFNKELEAKINDLVTITNIDRESLINIISEALQKPSGRIVLLTDTLEEFQIIGFSLFHWVRSSALYDELRDTRMCQYIRDNSLGRMILIHCLEVKNTDKFKGLEQILITETLAFCLSRDYQFAIFKNILSNNASSSMYDTLKLQGFIEISTEDSLNPTYVVDMSTPCVLNLDTENLLKEPFRSNTKIKAAIASSRRKLQIALNKLYPGELMLSFDSNMLHQSMIRKICDENLVPTEACEPPILGSAMCVPYGDILERYIIPNTVTKALHTEKLFNADMKDFSIGPFPYYLDLESQVKMIKSFKRPVILVDNILHKGYRMKALDPLLKKEGIYVKKILCGILSGRGKDLMDMQKREVDSVYFVPRLKVWFNENSLYPFIGGDALWRGSFPERNLLPSINLILPYTSPTFIKNAPMEAIYNLSKVCLENSLDILNSLESEYHFIHERNLSLLNMGQVFTVPRCPDKGRNMDYDLNLSPSLYLKNDLELLFRFQHIFSGLK
ncbi:cytidyltransferase [Candidatus Clostridium stratigraminis]|uniref:nicotinate-nucleotide adenylyltransferase n=1 Tax=Candidatus Clostridium stratigraminis TaxID=3381661 RepID=A0ABW8T5T6_9CLOT